MADTIPTDGSSQRVKLRLELDRRINFAMQQNDVPVVKAVRIENVTSDPLRDLEVRITGEPEFSQPWSTRLALVEAGAAYGLNAIDLQLSPSYLSGLTERVRGMLRLEVRRAEEILLSQSEPVDLLARDEWEDCRRSRRSLPRSCYRITPP